jgi:hypothetical protein
VVDIFIGLAAAVVKAGVKIWLKDDAFAADVSASVAGLVAAKISDDLDQRKIRRFFEDLEVPVAKRLRALRQAEFGRLPENEWNAAVLAAGDSFDRAQLTAKDLFTRDLDPLFLERYVRRSDSRAARDMSEGGTALYDRLISEGCAYVIEIADKLPHFQAGAFTELLRRDRQMLDRIDEVLDRIPDKAAGQSEEARFVTACRRHIATRLDRLELFGLDFEARWYPLSVAYVSLRAEQEVDAGRQAIEDRLAANARMMLVGRAGSGKTTVLQWLAVRAARSGFAGALASLNDHFPFFIRLRDYVGKRLPRPEEFLASTAPLLVDEAPPGWARAQLSSGRALVLVDGVDELPASERDRVATWLGDLVERFPDATYVITARPTAVSDSWLDDIGFARASLEAMPPSLVKAFVRNWHEATRQQLSDADERQRLESYERSLLADITKDRYLRDLADTPLLAGLLCALNRYLRSNLPRRRSEIYERTLAMFDQRDQARSIVSAGLRLDLTAKTHVLADLALWMIRNGESEVNVTAAAEQVGRSLAGLPNAAYQPEAAFRFLLERSGLLREPAAGRVDFVHRTFQEYLAAKAAVDGDAIGELVRNGGNDQWGEVVVLAAGQANQVQAAHLLRGLLRRAWRGGQRYARRVLAVACLQEIRSLDPALRQEVESIIPDLLPPQSMEQAEQLSAAGEALIEPLTSHWSRDPEKARETIRAASLIGGRAAMNLIRDVSSSYQGDRNLSLELGRAWQYFDTDDYAQRVLAAAEVEELDIGSARYLQALTNVPSIRKLKVNCDEYEVANLDPPAEFPRLESLALHLSGESPIDLSWLAGCQRLETLRIWNYQHRDLSHLPSVSRLQELEIHNPKDLANLTGIERQRSLSRIALYRCPHLTTVRDINSLASLSRLLLFHVPYLDLSGFELRNNLTIFLFECGEIDLTPLAGVRGLSIYRDKSTQLHHAAVLGEGSSVSNMQGILSTLWPFN